MAFGVATHTDVHTETIFCRLAHGWFKNSPEKPKEVSYIHFILFTFVYCFVTSLPFIVKGVGDGAELEIKISYWMDKCPEYFDHPLQSFDWPWNTSKFSVE